MVKLLSFLNKIHLAWKYLEGRKQILVFVVVYCILFAYLRACHKVVIQTKWVILLNNKQRILWKNLGWILLKDVDDCHATYNLQ